MQLTAEEISVLRRTFLDYRSTEDFIRNPLVLKRAEGLYYWDTEGKRYFDAIGGVFVATLGHGHPRILSAMREQMGLMTFAPPLHGIADVTLKFVEKLGSVCPGNLRYVKPFSGGSEAVESALKFARQYFKQTGHPGKYKFISRYSSYHGGTFGGMSASGTGERKAKFEPQMPGFLKVFPPSFYRNDFGSWEEANRFAARSVEDIIVAEDPSTVAAVIVEPIGNTGGVITPTVEYFLMLRDICTRRNVLLIFDEIITGIAKTGNMFAAQTYGVTPDILCLGKGISNGAVPLAAMVAREDLASSFHDEQTDANFFAHGHTFAGNPLACAVGIAVLDEIVENKFCQKAARLGEYLRRRLERLKQTEVVREVRGKGIFLGVELVRDTKTMAPFPELGTALKRTALRNGLILRIDPSWFAVAPPLIAEESDLDEMCDLIEGSLQEALREVRG